MHCIIVLLTWPAHRPFEQVIFKIFEATELKPLLDAANADSEAAGRS